MFSRPIRPHSVNINLIENAFIENEHYDNKQNARMTNKELNSKKTGRRLNWKEFYKNTTRLEKCKIAELREILKIYKESISFVKDDNYTSTQMQIIKSKYDFFLTGKKEDLIRRVKGLFEKEHSAVQIQKCFRRHIVLMDIKLRGPALKNRSLCVNDSDFYTLDLLTNVPMDSFFSYKGEGDFIYGFDLNSIISLIKNSKNNKLINPYNRESMASIMTSIQLLIRTNNILRKKVSCNKNKTVRSTNISANNSYNPAAVIEDLRKIREKPLNQRITDLFIEIDQLGNYTQSEWFSQLNRNDNIRFFRGLYDIWNYRAQLSVQIKLKICPLFDPFLNLPFAINQIMNLSDDQLKLLTLSVMEHMILMGIDNDHKMIGTLHVLTALTIVSQNARSNLPWLYESLVF
jgi:hypothetical protein